MLTDSLLIIGESTINSLCCGSCFLHDRIFCILSHLVRIPSVSYLFYVPKLFTSILFPMYIMQCSCFFCSLQWFNQTVLKEFFFVSSPRHFSASEVKGDWYIHTLRFRLKLFPMWPGPSTSDTRPFFLMLGRSSREWAIKGQCEQPVLSSLCCFSDSFVFGTRCRKKEISYFRERES